MIIQRILQFIDYKSISKSEFYRETGLSNGFLDKNRDFGVSKLVNILKKYEDLNPFWILYGQGQMLIEKNQNVVREPEPQYSNDQYLIDLQKKHIENLEKEIELLKKNQQTATHYK